MDPVRTIRLHWAQGGFTDATPQLLHFRFYRHEPHAWQPAINAYRCEASIAICVDLAGVDHGDIDLQIESRRILLRGQRDNPEPSGDKEHFVQTLALEIDYGPFVRAISLPAEIDPDKACAHHENGFLWITLPLKEP
jgi:HSP20 family protein